MTRKTGTGTITGCLKGLVEMVLFSSLGSTVIMISVMQGLVVDLVYGTLKGNSVWPYLSGGLSSMSNVAVLQLLLMSRTPSWFFAIMYVSAFILGILFLGLIGVRVTRTVSRMNL